MTLKRNSTTNEHERKQTSFKINNHNSIKKFCMSKQWFGLNNVHVAIRYIRERLGTFIFAKPTFLHIYVKKIEKKKQTEHEFNCLFCGFNH